MPGIKNGTGCRTSVYQTLGSPRVGFQSLRLVSGLLSNYLKPGLRRKPTIMVW